MRQQLDKDDIVITFILVNVSKDSFRQCGIIYLPLVQILDELEIWILFSIMKAKSKIFEKTKTNMHLV